MDLLALMIEQNTAKLCGGGGGGHTLALIPKMREHGFAV